MTVHTTKPPKMPVNLAGIPDELKRIPNWHVWRWEYREKSQKWDKPPYAIDGSYGSSTDSAKWCDYNEAVRALPNFDGLGLAMGDGIGLIGVDLDSCRDPESGFLSIEAQSIVDELGTYAEVSPSGTGIKLWIKGDYDKSKWRSKVGNVETYCNGRYFTVTGQTVNSAPIAEVGPKFFAFLDKYLSKANEPPTTERAATEVSDDAARMKHAINACLKVEIPESEGDGSRRMIKYCRQCVRAGLTPEAAVKVVRTMEMVTKPMPEPWSDDRIKTRYEQAKTQSDVGEAIKVYEQSDYGVARRLCDMLGNQAAYIREWQKWVTWTGRNFEVGVTRKVMEATILVSKQLLEQTPAEDGTKEQAAKVKAYRNFAMQYQSHHGTEAVRKMAEKMLDRSFHDLDKKIDLFHCENATLHFDPKSGEVSELTHDPANLNTQISQVVYNPEARCPTWLKFLNEICLDKNGKSSPELIDYLQRIAGYCLTGRVIQSVFILHGGGRNGKGAFCRMLLKLLGQYGISIRQEMLVNSNKSKGHDTQFASLYGKRCIIAQEADQGCYLNESQVKWLTGGDPIRCRRMREDEWEFVPTHKMFLATNNLPNITGTDFGIWRRIKLIPFKARVVEDLTLEERMISELPGILNWAIEGYRKACGPEGLDEPLAVTEANQSYQADMDIVGQFVAEKCVLVADGEVENSQLYQAFNAYCEGIGLRAPSNRKLTQDLLKMGVTTKCANSKRLKIGISIKSEFDEPPNSPPLF